MKEIYFHIIVIKTLKWSCKNICKKILWKKRLESKLRKNCVVNLFNEPQHLVEIKLRNLLKFQTKGNKFVRTKVYKTTNQILWKQNNKYAKNVHVSFPMSRSEFFDVIGLFAKSQTLRVNAKRLQRGERKEKLLLEILKRKRFF